MKPMTADIRKQIDLRIKNGLDISLIIKDVNIKGENLSGAIIKDFNRCEEDLSNTNFSKAIIGEEGKVTVFCNNILNDCNFMDSIFLGKVFARHCKGKRMNFSGANLGRVEFQHSSLRDCKWCGAIIKVGSIEWLGVDIDDNLFKDWSKALDVNITITKK